MQVTPPEFAPPIAEARIVSRDFFAELLVDVLCMIVMLWPALLTASLLVALTACTAEDAYQAGAGETLAETIARECKEKMLDCELVYAFDTPASNSLGRVEMCVRKDDLPLAESMFGASELSPDKRFDQWKLFGIDPICYWHCGAGPGCNAFGDNEGRNACFNCPTAVPMLEGELPYLPFDLVPSQ